MAFRINLFYFNQSIRRHIRRFCDRSFGSVGRGRCVLGLSRLVRWGCLLNVDVQFGRSSRCVGLVDLGYVTEQQILLALGEQAGMEVVDLDEVNIPPELIELVSKSVTSEPGAR